MVEQGYARALVDDAIAYCKAQLIAEVVAGDKHDASGGSVDEWVDLDCRNNPPPLSPLAVCAAHRFNYFGCCLMQTAFSYRTSFT